MNKPALEDAVLWEHGFDHALAILQTTSLLLLGVLAISVPVGTFLATMAARTDLPCRRFVAVLLGLMLIVPLYLQTGAWQAGFGLQGWFTVWSRQPELLYDLRGAIWVHAMAAIPWVALIVGVGLRLVEPELEEEAMLHARAGQVFRHVTLRRAAGAIGVAALWVAVSTGSEMTVSDLFRVRTAAEEIYLAFAATSDIEAATLQLLPQIVVNVVLLVLGGALCLKLMPRSRAIAFRKLPTYRLGAWRWPLAGLTLLILVVIIGVPLANLVYKAGYEGRAMRSSFEQSWSVTKLLTMAGALPGTPEEPGPFQTFDGEMLSSLKISVLAATTTLVLGTALAWWGRNGRFRTPALCLIVALLLSLPAPLLSAGVGRALAHFPLVYDSYAAPCTAISLRTLPIAVLILWYALRRVPDEALELARVEGAGGLACLLKVAIPLCWPAMIVAWLVGFLLAIGDVAASQMVQLPGRETLAWRVFDRLHSGADDQVSGVFITLIVIFALAGALIFGLLALAARRTDATRSSPR
jgi:iron(III) transport system permease protein